jgi:hypothetical protein
MAAHAACVGETRNTFNKSVRKPEAKRTLGRHRHKGENIKVDLKQTGCEDMECTELA